MKILSKISAFAITAFFAAQAMAAGSPWLPTPQGGSVSVAYVDQSATEYWRQTKRATPGGHELSQQTIWVNGNYGVSDAVALDFQIGRAESSFPEGPGLPPSRANTSDLTDLKFGLTWRIADEVMNPDLPSLALRAGVVRGGGYETGIINALGDGADGFEFSAIAGKFLGDRFAVSGELGYRSRDHDMLDVPDSWFYHLRAGVFLSNQFSVSLNYDIEDSIDGLQIGMPPFTPTRFPEVEEDIHLLSASVNFVATDSVTLSGAWGQVIDGINTAASDVFSFSLSYSFF